MRRTYPYSVCCSRSVVSSVERRLAVIHRAPVRSDDVDVFTADASELYRHTEEAIFLVLIIGSERILMHVDDGEIGGATSPCKVREHLLDGSDEVRLLPRKFSVVQARHDSHLKSERKEGCEFPAAGHHAAKTTQKSCQRKSYTFRYAGLGNALLTLVAASGFD